MPRIHHCSSVAQRIVYPNRTRSAPFIAPLSKERMVDFAKKIIEGYWPRPADQYPEHQREDLGTCRLEGTFGGRFRRTLELWGSHCDDEPMLVATRRSGILSYTDILVAFIEMGRGGGVYSYIAMGGTDICRAIAITTLEWSSRVEEWPDSIS